MFSAIPLRIGFILFFTMSLAFCRQPPPVRATAESDQLKKPVAESIRLRQDTQSQEQHWREDREKLLARLDQLTAGKQQLTGEVAALHTHIDATKTRVATKDKQLRDVAAIQQDIAPLIASLIAELQTFVEGDLPFLTVERRQRLQRLTELRDDPEVAVSEKLRKVLEAILVEAEYGNTIETTRETIAMGDKKALVDIFRLGRVALFYQSLDRTACGVYDVAKKTWKPLPADYRHAIHSAMEIGSKRRSVELLALPLGRLQPQ